MRKIITSLVCLAAIAVSAVAAPVLSYETSGDNLVVTAADGGNQYWSMTVDVGSTKPGRIMGFYDLSGSSSSTYNYGHDYSFGSGMLDPVDNGDMRSGGKWAISGVNQGSSSLTFTLSRDAVKDTGTATYSMQWTISAPTVTAGGYATNIHVDNFWQFDANWVGANGEVRARSLMRLNAANGDEFTYTTHNGVAAGDPAELHVIATVSGTNSDMAAGSTFAQKLTYGLHDSAYDAATGKFTTFSTPVFQGFVDLGASGNWAGNPGGAGSERLFSNAIDLDISVIPEPATMSLLGMGLVGLIIRRRRAR